MSEQNISGVGGWLNQLVDIAIEHEMAGSFAFCEPAIMAIIWGCSERQALRRLERVARSGGARKVWANVPWESADGVKQYFTLLPALTEPSFKLMNARRKYEERIEDVRQWGIGKQADGVQFYVTMGDAAKRWRFSQPSAWRTLNQMVVDKILTRVEYHHKKRNITLVFYRLFQEGDE